MIQQKFGTSKCAPSHYNGLSHLRLPEWRQLSRPLGNRSHEKIKVKTPPKKRCENAEDIQHYYSTKNLVQTVHHKHTNKGEATRSSSRPKAKRSLYIVGENSQRVGAASPAKTSRKTLEKCRHFRTFHCQSTIQLSNRFTKRNLLVVSEEKPDTKELQRMAQQIADLKAENERLSKLYNKIVSQKQAEQMRMRDYEVQVEQKNIILRKRICNLNSELREYKPNDRTIYHIDTYKRVDPEAYAPALVSNRIDEAAVSLQQSIQKAMTLSELMRTEQNTDTCESPASCSLKNHDTLSVLSLESQML